MANLSHYDQANLFGANVAYSDLLEEKDLCHIIKNEIAPLLKDSDFEDMYKDGGRPPVSPRILALTLLMQFLERLPDRAASLNLRYRLDWKIAFGLPIDFSGIHPTTLVYFRDRLVQSKKGSFVFDRVLDHLKACGLVKKNGKQRIDSTHIIGCVRELSRIELFHETLRLFCEDITSFKAGMDQNFLSNFERYVDPISTHGITDVQKRELIQAAGLAMRSLILWGEQECRCELVTVLKSFATLKTVFEQNFTEVNQDQAPEMIPVSTGKGHISSPHETEATYANKGKKGWIGYKGQVVETVNESESEDQNFITHIDIEDSTSFDGDCVKDVINELHTKEITPNELYGDTHYNTENNIKDLAKESIDLKGPVQPNTRELSEKNKGFKIDLEQEKVTCPAGVGSKHFHLDHQGKARASFPKESCIQCHRRDICKPQPRGKIYEGKPESKILAERREKLQTPEYRRDLHHRNGIEGTLSGLVRGQSWRRCRYRGKNKAQLQAKFSGAAANVTRLYRQRPMERYREQKIIGEAA